jgi:hypothetical protein
LLRDIVTEYDECTGKSTAPVLNSTAATGTVKVITRLNIRSGNPSTKSPVVQVAGTGTTLNYVEVIVNGEKINGNNKWYKDANGNFFWSGGVGES